MKSFWTILIIVVIVVLGVWLWSSGPSVDTGDETATSTDGEPELGADSLEAIEGQLEGVGVDGLEGELDALDEDLENL